MTGSHVPGDDPARIDLEVVRSFLSEQAYWGRWRTRADVGAQVRGSWRVVGAHGLHAGFGSAPPDGTLLERPGRARPT